MSILPSSQVLALSSQCHPNHQIELGNWVKTVDITEDQPDLEPDTDPMPAYVKVGIELIWSQVPNANLTIESGFGIKQPMPS